MMTNDKELAREFYVQFLLDHDLTLEDPPELSPECRRLLAQMMPVDGISETQANILQALESHDHLKNKELASAAIGKKHSDGQFRGELAEMVRRGLILSGTGRASKGYEITPKGRTALQAHQSQIVRTI